MGTILTPALSAHMLQGQVGGLRHRAETQEGLYPPEKCDVGMRSPAHEDLSALAFRGRENKSPLRIHIQGPALLGLRA